jgi:hypothetical protein
VSTTPTQWQERAKKAEAGLACEKALADDYHARWQQATDQLMVAHDALKRVQKQAAAMREVLENCRRYIHDFQMPEIQNILSSDAGRDYISRESVRPLVQAITESNELLKDIALQERDEARVGAQIADNNEALQTAREMGLLPK